MKKKEILSTNTVGDVRRESQRIADSLASIYHTTKDLKAAMGALDGYRTALNAMKAQVIYKKLTGNPSSIAFFED